MNFTFCHFQNETVDRSEPVYILELGAGHGRFTFLVLKALLRYKDQFSSFNLPSRPFVYVYSDVAEANIDFCSKHPKLKELANDGWLDFAFVDGNIQPLDINLRLSGYRITSGTPLVAIANYVLDSLLTDAFKIEDGELYRGMVAMYSPLEERDLTNPDIMRRMSVTWKWGKLGMGGGKESKDMLCPEYLRGENGESIWNVINKYMEEGEDMSFMLPVGSLMLLKELHRLAGGNMLMLVGDKGYTTSEEFQGIKTPHIAIHGSVSFMVNLHSLRIYVEDSLGGRSLCTPWRDTFQLVGLWGRGWDISEDASGLSNCPVESSVKGCNRQFASSLFAFMDDLEDMSPDSLVSWQRDLAERISSSSSPMNASGGNLKTLLALLRYSGHDPDVFWNFRSQFTKWCVPPFTSSRTDADISIDMEHVYNNWYSLRKGEDVPDLCGHVCMKTGKCDKAVYFFKESIKFCPEALHAATYINAASCYKVIGNIDEAWNNCSKALEMSPGYPPGLDMQIHLRMWMKPIRVALVGFGIWMRNECLPLILREKRCQVVTAVAHNEKERIMFEKYLNPAVKKPFFHKRETESPNSEMVSSTSDPQHTKTDRKPRRTWANVISEDFTVNSWVDMDKTLARSDVDACLIDVHADRDMKHILTRAWEAGKHTLMRTPVAFTAVDVFDLINKYSLISESLAWYVIENNRTDDAFAQAKSLLSSLGTPVAAQIEYLTDSAMDKPPMDTSPYTEQEYLAIELLHCLNALHTIIDQHVTAVSVQHLPHLQHGIMPEAVEGSGPKVEASSLSGWVRFGGSVTVSVRVTRWHSGDHLLKYSINSTQGTFEMERAGSGKSVVIHLLSVRINIIYSSPSLSHRSSLRHNLHVMSVCCS
eukprot:GHVQ01031476.1.p1 GENE.GHVQ01031476.1~~GHVQ01031476.1.p1  ORF type:complete len:874 (-),score=107.67 GHVQ01031476.1:880-3501(-)